MNSIEEQLLTQKQLAAALPLPERTVRYLSETGKIPVIKISPRIVRYSLSAVREAILAKTIPATGSSSKPVLNSASPA